MKTITSLSLDSIHKKTKAGTIDVDVSAKIDDKGNLVIQRYDRGSAHKAITGDYDCEYYHTISKEFKDTILLHLIKDRFEDYIEFRKWLDTKKIPHEDFVW